MQSTVTRRSNAQAILKQLDFAELRALTALAKDAQAEVKAELPKRFDRPTPFVVGGVSMRAATRARPWAEVYLKPATTAVLAKHEDGDTVTPEPGRPLTQPINARTNQYGNLPRSFWQSIKRMQVAKPYQGSQSYSVKTRKSVRKYGGGIFVVGEPKGRHAHLKPGVYQRPMRTRGKDASKVTALKMLVALRKKATYQKRLGLADTTAAIVHERFGEKFAAAWREALATAR